MVNNLEKAFAEASKLPKPEQEALAVWILQELASDKIWGEAFDASEDALSRLADEAVEDHHHGRTKVYDTDTD